MDGWMVNICLQTLVAGLEMRYIQEMCVGPRDRFVDLVTQIVSEEHLWDRRCLMDLVSCLACHLVDGGYKFPPWCICGLVQIFEDRPFVGPSLPNRPYVLSSPGAWWTVDMNPPHMVHL